MTRLTFLCALFAFSACGCTPDSAKPKEDKFVAPKADVNTYESTVFSAKKDAVGASLGELGAPWTSELNRSTRNDSFSGGTIISTLFSGASYEVFLDPSDRVWRIRLNSGFSSKCGDKNKLLTAAKAIIPTLETGTEMGKQEIEAASKSLNRNEIYSADLGNMRVAFSGSCVSSATFSAQ